MVQLQKMLSILVLLFVGANAHAYPVGDFVRNSEGRPLNWVLHITAAKECERRGMRLPTARELAEDAGLFVIEVDDHKHLRFPVEYAQKDFIKVSTVELDGTMDDFYYSLRTYVRPKDAKGKYTDKGKYNVWSSSIKRENGLAMFFRPYQGTIDQSSGFGWPGDSVRCSLR